MTFYSNARQNVAMERESQMKETMKIMGLTNAHYWLAWFVKCLLMLLLPLVFMVLVLTVSVMINCERLKLFLYFPDNISDEFWQRSFHAFQPIPYFSLPHSPFGFLDKLLLSGQCHV